jgi:hypothetical protein
MLAMLMATNWTWPTYAGRWCDWGGGLVSIRHYQLRCRKEASSNCYHKRKKAGKKIREKVVLIMRELGVSIEEDLSNEQKPIIPEAERRYLSSAEMRSCTAQYFRAAMGAEGLNEGETRRDELILRHRCSMRVKLFLGRGQTAKWFVLQQPLTSRCQMGNTKSSAPSFLAALGSAASLSHN